MFTSNAIVREMQKDRVFGLDLLRAIAIIYVLMGHAGLFMPMNVQIFQACLIWVDPVTLFFVLSGFLIGRILIKTFEQQKMTPKTLLNFWSRRWLRTLPAFFVMLILLTLIYDKLNDKHTVVKYIFFVQNFNSPHPDWFPEAWSLSIEEWFYLLTPIVLLLILSVAKADTRRAVLFLSMSVILAFPLFRLYKYVNIPVRSLSDLDLLFRKQVTTRLDSIMFGVLGAYVFYYFKDKWNRHKNLLAIVGFVMVLILRFYSYSIATREGLFSSVFSFSIESLGVLLMLPYFEGIKKGRGTVASGITFLSIISYSIYLINFSLVGLWLMQKMPDFGLSENAKYFMSYVMFCILSILGSVILYLTVEHPFIRLRDKIAKDKSVQSPDDRERVESDSIPLPSPV